MKPNEFKEIINSITPDKYIVYGYYDNKFIVNYILIFKQCLDDINARYVVKYISCNGSEKINSSDFFSGEFNLNNVYEDCWFYVCDSIEEAMKKIENIRLLD